MTQAQPETTPPVQEIDLIASDRRLQDLVTACVRRQRELVERDRPGCFRPNPDAREFVSEKALTERLTAGDDVSDLRTHPQLSNCVVFHTTNLDGSLLDPELLELRRAVDVAVKERLVGLFAPTPIDVEVSGHFWYPPDGFMAWHTNARKPGWRFYVSLSEGPGESFFRYRDPKTGVVETCLDDRWNLRLFHISAEEPLWHAVYSGTNRYSLGYRVTPRD